jgi:hypothetical protein
VEVWHRARALQLRPGQCTYSYAEPAMSMAMQNVGSTHDSPANARPPVPTLSGAPQFPPWNTRLDPSRDSAMQNDVRVHETSSIGLDVPPGGPLTDHCPRANTWTTPFESAARQKVGEEQEMLNTAPDVNGVGASHWPLRKVRTPPAVSAAMQKAVDVQEIALKPVFDPVCWTAVASTGPDQLPWEKVNALPLSSTAMQVPTWGQEIDGSPPVSLDVENVGPWAQLPPERTTVPPEMLMATQKDGVAHEMLVSPLTPTAALALHAPPLNWLAVPLVNTAEHVVAVGQDTAPNASPEVRAVADDQREATGVVLGGMLTVVAELLDVERVGVEPVVRVAVVELAPHPTRTAPSAIVATATPDRLRHAAMQSWYFDASRWSLR